jgi:lipoate-protein ligase B
MCSRGNKKLFRIDTGVTKYSDAWDVQKRLVGFRSQGKIPDCLILTEHHPVITLGRGSSPNNLLVSRDYLRENGIDLHEVERGGDITFHGPGQAVLYPIIDLRNRNCDVHRYLRDLERVVIGTLEELGLDATTKEGLTGIWVDDHKVGAIGVAVSKWITYHGLALNVTTNLDYFKLINPCGITEFPVGSVSGLLGRDIELDHVSSLLAGNFARMFYYEIETPENVSSLLNEHSSV